VDRDFLGRDAAWSCRRLPAFPINLSSPSSGFRREGYLEGAGDKLLRNLFILDIRTVLGGVKTQRTTIQVVIIEIIKT
jgi:hypothetical protein